MVYSYALSLHSLLMALTVCKAECDIRGPFVAHQADIFQ